MQGRRQQEALAELGTHLDQQCPLLFGLDTLDHGIKAACSCERQA